MTDTKYTPGPWKVFKARDGHNIIGIGDINGEGITDCGFGVWRGDSIEALANATLIAAAPDLLEALKNLAEQIQQVSDGDRPYTGFDTEFIDAAIAKAELELNNTCKTRKDCIA